MYSDSAGLGWGLGFCMSNRFPCDIKVAGSRIVLCVARVWQTDISMVAIRKVHKVRIIIMSTNITVLAKNTPKTEVLVFRDFY